jgi:hypothetical protein
MTDEILIQPAVPASALPTQVRRAATGAEPDCRAVTCPRCSTSSVGMAWAPNRGETRGELPDVHFDQLDLACQVTGEFARAPG